MSVPEPDPDPAIAPDTGRVRPPAWEALAIGGALALGFVAAAWWMTRGPVVEDGRAMYAKAAVDPNYGLYVGNRACRDCHPGESAAHSRSGHARTLRPAAKVDRARKLDGRQVEDPERPGVAWRYSLRDGRLFTDREEAGAVERFLIEYAFGSGRHAVTFVSLLDRDPARPTSLEHRLTGFAHSGALDLTPGQMASSETPGNTPHGRIHPAWNTLKCFSCHVTVTSDRGPAFLDEATMIPNVSCERCHGPAKSHVEAARRGASGEALAMPSGFGRWTAPEQMRLCGECHRLPEMGAPGETRIDNPSIVRHQPVGLMQTVCYTKSNGALSCVTCHDPHARSSTDRAAYQAACLACHGPSPQVSCPVSPSGDCVDCHMPRRDVGRGMMMTDHWIRVVPELDPRRPTGASVPGPGPVGTAREP